MELPIVFVDRMKRLLGDAYTEFLRGYDTPVHRGLRVNTLKLPAEAFVAQFPESLSPTPFCADGFSVRADFKAGADAWHHAGAYYMQEPSAMSAVTVLSPRSGERVLDLCAAPGGKSTQIAAALNGTGLLWSNEYVRTRASVLAQNIERCGIRNAVVSNMDTAVLCDTLKSQFDAVLADVPCSGEGMFRKEPNALTMWSEDAIALCAERGAYILNAAANAVRPGGRLVYSTCTFAPEENECQIARFLQHHPDFSLVPITVSWGRAAFSWDQVRSFADDKVNGAPYPLEYARRIFPSDGGEGHFIALLKREGDASIPHPRLCKKEKEDINAAACRALMAECFTRIPQGRLVTVGDTVRLLPLDIPQTEGLYLVDAGIAVATVRRNRLEPCHGIFQAMSASDCRQVLALTREDTRTTAFLRGEVIDAPNVSGWTAVFIDGVACGFGKAGNGVLKNHYPKALRLLR